MTRGRITLLITAAITGSALLLSGQARQFFFTIGMTGMVGCTTNSLAIRMLFDPIYVLPWWRKWQLPYSGVIEAQRQQIAEGIAWVVSQRLLTPEVIMKTVRSPNFQTITQQILSEKIGTVSQDAILLENLLQEIEFSLLNFVDSDIFKHKLQQAVYQRLGWVGEKLVSLDNFRRKDKVTPRLQKEIKRVLEYICADHLFSEAMRDFVENLPEKFFDIESPLKEDIQRYGAAVLKDMIEKLELEQVVIEEISGFPVGDLRGLMLKIMAENLDWLEVWGGIFGAMGGAVFWGISRSF